VATSVLTAGPVEFDPRLYPQSCLEAAAAAYAKFLRVEKTLSEDGAICASLVTFPAFSPREVQIRREFLNYLLDLSIQRYLRT
jgi:hypothetical protein